MNKKLSFIVPVYNVAPYLKRCFSSLLAQNIPYSDYEIVVVDDGSTDDSPKIIAEYSEKYPNVFKTFRKENKGLSSSRNYGLKHSEGEYIWFIDSDDFIEENCLKSILEKISTENVDFLTFPVTKHIGETKILWNVRSKPNKIVDNETYLKKHFSYCYSSWFFIVKRDIIIENNIYFIEGITQEDFEYLIRLLEYCKRIGYFNSEKGIYNYVMGRTDSIVSLALTNRKNALLCLDSFSVFIPLLQKKYSENKKDSYSKLANCYINNFKCYALAYLLYLNIPYSDRKFYFEKYKKAGFFSIGKTYFLTPKLSKAKKIFSIPFLYKIIMKMAPYLKKVFFNFL